MKKFLIGVGILVVLVVVGAVGEILINNHRLAARTSTIEGPLVYDPNDPEQLLPLLDPIKSINSLRIEMAPSFRYQWLAVAIYEDRGRGYGESLVYDREHGTIKKRKFGLPRSELHSFLYEWDALTDGYSGEARMWLDGTSIAFERRRGGRITSAHGNSPCHDDVLGDLAARRLTRYVPELAEFSVPNLEKILESDVCKTGIFKWL
ncbi:MAG: hypothetical protein U1E68_06205 [Sphingomonadaceae bacterium]|jgi:hypothetical protein